MGNYFRTTCFCLMENSIHIFSISFGFSQRMILEEIVYCSSVYVHVNFVLLKVWSTIPSLLLFHYWRSSVYHSRNHTKRNEYVLSSVIPDESIKQSPCVRPLLHGSMDIKTMILPNHYLIVNVFKYIFKFTRLKSFSPFRNYEGFLEKAPSRSLKYGIE